LFVNVRFDGITEPDWSRSSCSSFIFVKYNIELFLLIDKIISIGKSTVFVCLKNYILLKINHHVGNCNRHVINIWNILWSHDW